MRYAAQIVIERPQPRVIELIRDPANLPAWQIGLKNVALLSGDPGQPGARSRYVFDMAGFSLEMVETIVRYSPPDLFVSFFEAKGVENHVENRFYEDEPEKTRWVMVNNLKFKGAMAILGVIVYEAISRQVRESMKQFKLFAERS